MFKNIIVIVSMVLTAACGEESEPSMENDVDGDGLIDEGTETYTAEENEECCTCLFECAMNQNAAFIAENIDQALALAKSMGIADIEGWAVDQCSVDLAEGKKIQADLTCFADGCPAECGKIIRTAP